MLLSINRYEGKKDLALALEAFALVRSSNSAQEHTHKPLRLVLAGGYDPRLADNVRTLAQLQQLASRLGLSSHAVATGGPLPAVPSPVAPRFRPVIAAEPPATAKGERAPDVLFLLNVTARQKALLLDSAKSGARALLYTPMYEHFGIVPLEGMAAGLPVVATTSGGPTETVVDRGLGDDAAAVEGTTGLLRPRDPAAWAEALSALLALSPERRAQVGTAGRARVRGFFSLERLGEDFERACTDAARQGMPIPYEVGYKKMLAFVAIGSVCTASGVAAYLVGRM